MLDLSLITDDSDEQNQLWLLGPVKQYKIGLLSDVGWTPQLRTWVAVLDSSIVMCIYIYIISTQSSPIFSFIWDLSRIFVSFHVDILI